MSVIVGPVAKCARRCSGDFGNRRCDKSRLSGSGGPGVEQHIEYERWHRQLASGLVRRDLLDVERTTENAADYRYLVELGERFRSSQNIFLPECPASHRTRTATALRVNARTRTSLPAS